jgi:hypothetical protein
MTLRINGFRISARTNSARPIRRRSGGVGVSTSTATTRSIPGSETSRHTTLPPKYRLAPVTSTTLGL